jgi:hypothetical protein
MKYLRKFNENLNSIGQDLSDIFLEVNDETFWKAESWYEENLPYSNKLNWIVVIQTIDEDEEYELEGQTPLPIVIESIERSIEFMNGEGFTNYVITFENDDDIHKGGSAEFEEITLEEVSNLDVWPNNFIRIEFTK